MTQKKSPRCLAAVGADQKGGKEFLASSNLATPARPAQGESCDRCQFFRIVALASGHDRKLRTAAGWCDLFAPGKWGELRPLTRALALGMVEFPNQTRRSKRLSSIPNAGRSLAAQTAFAVNAPAGRMPGGLLAHIGRVVTSSIREDWRLRLSRGALYPAFFISPESNEAPMHSIIPAALRHTVVALPCNLIPAGEVRHA